MTLYLLQALGSLFGALVIAAIVPFSTPYWMSVIGIFAIAMILNGIYVLFV
jgi:Na+-translocating ferredoxin:NAD+ oxidoreductase RnfD subunit